jgi:hypothetical protein
VVRHIIGILDAEYRQTDCCIPSLCALSEYLQNQGKAINDIALPHLRQLLRQFGGQITGVEKHHLSAGAGRLGPSSPYHFFEAA